MATFMLIVVLLISAMLLIMVEICTPSFGLLGMCATACLIWGGYECFVLESWLGWVYVICCVIGVPVYLSAMMRIMPSTPLGRWLILQKVRAGVGESLPETADNNTLVGKQGKALTVLRPVGAVEIDGDRVIAMAESGLVEAGTDVKVVRVSGANIVVRPIQD